MYSALLALAVWMLTTSQVAATEFSQDGRYALVFTGTVASGEFDGPQDNGLFAADGAMLAGLPFTVALTLHIPAFTELPDPNYATNLGGLNQSNPLTGTLTLAGKTHVFGAGFADYDTLGLVRMFNFAQFTDVGGVDAIEIDLYRVKLVNQQALGDDLSLGIGSQAVDFLNTGDIRKPLSLDIPAGVFGGGSYTYTDGLTLASLRFDVSHVSISAVPEPAGWMMMVLGFGAVGWALRRRGHRLPPVPDANLVIQPGVAQRGARA